MKSPINSIIRSKYRYYRNKKFRFVVIANGERYETDMHFSNRVPFRRRRNDSLIRDKKELRYSFRANGFIVRDLNLNSADAAKRKLWLSQKIALEDIGSAIKQYRLEAKKEEKLPRFGYTMTVKMFEKIIASINSNTMYIKMMEFNVSIFWMAMILRRERKSFRRHFKSILFVLDPENM